MRARLDTRRSITSRRWRDVGTPRRHSESGPRGSRPDRSAPSCPSFPSRRRGGDDAHAPTPGADPAGPVSTHPPALNRLHPFARGRLPSCDGGVVTGLFVTTPARASGAAPNVRTTAAADRCLFIIYAPREVSKRSADRVVRPTANSGDCDTAFYQGYGREGQILQNGQHVPWGELRELPGRMPGVPLAASGQGEDRWVSTQGNIRAFCGQRYGG